MLQQHLQDTYQYLFDAAHAALRQGGSFAPFGAGIRKTGEEIHANVDAPALRPGPGDHIGGLIAWFRADDAESGLMAAGLVFDGRARSDDGASALCFHIEAATGRAVEVIVPYVRRITEIDFSEPQVSEVHPEIFTDAK